MNGCVLLCAVPCAFDHGRQVNCNIYKCIAPICTGIQRHANMRLDSVVEPFLEEGVADLLGLLNNGKLFARTHTDTHEHEKATAQRSAEYPRQALYSLLPFFFTGDLVRIVLEVPSSIGQNHIATATRHDNAFA